MISAVTAASSATGRSLVPAATTAMVPGRLGSGWVLDGDAPGGFVVDRLAEGAAQAVAWVGGDAGDEQLAFWARMRRAMATVCSGVLPAPKMTSGKPFAQGAMGIDRGEGQVFDREPPRRRFRAFADRGGSRAHGLEQLARAESRGERVPQIPAGSRGKTEKNQTQGMVWGPSMEGVIPGQESDDQPGVSDSFHAGGRAASAIGSEPDRWWRVVHPAQTLLRDLRT
jgi:hypothetical protein